ncbi:MAG: hypothetical protein U9R25_09335 [Chloroflexota bacterium]|nr:hypothetical protein [Chloroflexota bacterium]
MARMNTDIDSLSMFDGERRTRSWNVRTVEPHPSSPQATSQGNLYILLEISGEPEASARLYRLLMNAIQGVYYDSTSDVRAALTEAILAGHKALQEHNSVYPDAVQLAGVNCAVLKGNELFLGVGGPAMVLVGHPERVEQFPGEIHLEAAPLGGAALPHIEIFRTSIGKEALILQLGSNWAANVPLRRLAGVALASDTETALEYLETLAPSDADLNAMAVHVTPSAQIAASAEALVAPIVAPPADQQEETQEGEPATEQDAAADTIEGEEPVEPEEVIASDGERAVELGQVTADPEPVAEPVVAEPPKKRRWWPWLLILLIPALIAAGIYAARWYQRSAVETTVDSLIQGAVAAYDAAIQEGVLDETARAQLQDAQERVQEAIELLPQVPEAADLQADIQARLNEVNSVTPLYKLLTLQELGGSGSEPSKIEMDGDRIYLLDRGLDRVTQYRIDNVSGLIPETSAGVLAERGQPLPDGQLVGELMDFVWADAGGNRNSSNLLILDSNRNLIEYDSATGLSALALADREAWQSPKVISSFIGNFYLVDGSETGRILRYRPTDDGYGNAPESYLEDDATIDFSRAIDVGIDGDIWVLYRDGMVQDFSEGRQRALEFEQPPDTPLAQPQAFFVGSEAGTAQNLYIVDSGNGRIVEFDKTGKYLQQFRPDDRTDLEKLRKMRDLYVDEIGGYFYILTEDGLYRTDIPQPQVEAEVETETDSEES